MAINLKHLELEHFKGIEKLEIEFGKETTIYGANGTGKTTVADAFSWLLWGKDSTGRSSFEIRPLDAENNPIHMVDCSVAGMLEKGGVQVSLKRIYREKWQKKKGAEEQELVGNEVVYEVNGVPVKQKEYTEKVSSLVDENVFRIITSPLYFNSLPWQERRKILMGVAGDISDEEVIGGNAKYKELIERISAEGSNLETWKKELASRRKKIEVELKEIPTRIDEASRAIPDDVDTAAVEAAIAGNKRRMAEIATELNSSSVETAEKNKSVNERILKLQKEVYDAKARLLEIEAEKRREEADERSQKEEELARCEKELSICKEIISNDTSGIEKLKTELQSKIEEKKGLVEQWMSINKECFEFDPDNAVCPTCGRPLDKEMVCKKESELRERFNADKLKRLKAVEEPGKRSKEWIAALEKEIPELEAEIGKFKKSLPDYEVKAKEAREAVKNVKHYLSRTRDDKEWCEITGRIDELQAEIENVSQSKVAVDDLSALQAEKSALEDSNASLAATLKQKEQRNVLLGRIEELRSEQKAKAQAIADIEKDEYLAESYHRDKMNFLEGKVNGLFTLVRYKLFNTLINGGEEECCIGLIDGVPFTDANTASRVNAGIDCINVISRHYGETAPIFIDGRESVTEVIQTDSQVVNLVVSEQDKKLRLSTN